MPNGFHGNAALSYMKLVSESHRDANERFTKESQEVARCAQGTQVRIQGISNNASASHRRFTEGISACGLDGMSYAELVHQYNRTSWNMTFEQRREFLERKEEARQREQARINPSDFPPMSMANETLSLIGQVNQNCNRQPQTRPLPFDINTASAVPSQIRTGMGTSQNIVVDVPEYNRINNGMINADDNTGRLVHNTAREVEIMCDTTYVLPRAVPRVRGVAQSVISMLMESQALTDELATQAKRYATDMAEIGSAKSGKNMSKMVWNALDAEDIRRKSMEAMQGTTEDMRNTINRFNKELQKLIPQIQALTARKQQLNQQANNIAATLPIMMWVTVPGPPSQRIQVVNEPVTNSRQRTVDRLREQAEEAQQQIDALQELVDQLEKSIERLTYAADELERMIERTNELFRDLHEQASSGDATGAANARDIKDKIDDYLRRIGELRDSIGNEFTTEADGQVYFGSSTGSILMNPTNFEEEFSRVASIFRRPYDQITDAQYSIAAWLFLNLHDYNNTAAGKQRFIRLLAEQVPSTHPHLVSFTPTGNTSLLSPYMDVPNVFMAWTFCPNKMENLKAQLSIMTAETLREMLLLDEPTKPIAELHERYMRLLQSHTLLSLVAEIPKVLDQGSSSLENFKSQRLLAGTFSEPLIYITNWISSDGRFSGFNLNFTTTDYLRQNFIGGHVSAGVHNIQGHHHVISNADTSINITEKIRYNAANIIQNQFPVDLPLEVRQAMVLFVAKKLLENAIKDYGKKVTIPVSALMDAYKLITGNNKQNNENQRVIDLVDEILRDTRIGEFYSRLGFTAVVVNSGINQEVVAWPTDRTQRIIDEFNRIYRESSTNMNLGNFNLSYPLTLENTINNLNDLFNLYTGRYPGGFSASDRLLFDGRVDP